MLSTRPLEYNDIPLLLDYWFSATPAFLVGMGIDLSKMPDKGMFENKLNTLLATPVEQRSSYCIIWLNDGEPVGHCNTNPTTFGEEANMHLHLWKPAERQKGMGSELVKMTLPHFFRTLQLKTLWCEPYALNPAPNATLPKAGFAFVKEYISTPGSFSFEQPTKQWKMTREQFESLYGSLE